MRFIGSKDLLTDEIYTFLKNKNLMNKNLSFFDAFCGMGSISNSLKGKFNFIINDILNCCVIYTQARLNAEKCNFIKLGFDPFKFLNETDNIKFGFFYNNYSPGNSNRKYFTPENAGRIDFFREKIEDWFKNNLINKDEHNYLLACLMESVSKVANTAGVYGAFLKNWDKRAYKSIQFIEIPYKKAPNSNIVVYTNKLEKIIPEVCCDILYLDPPYTQNQYGTQYHLLETLVLNDQPNLSPVTGSRPITPYRSNFSIDLKAHIYFEKLIAHTRAKYILLSYSPDGFLSQKFIENVLKRYGMTKSYQFKKIKYKSYQNFKSKRKPNHSEFLFFIEKKEYSKIIFNVPINYTGSKNHLLGDIKKLIPSKIGNFVDVFGGGFNVGSNIEAKKIIYNDINFLVKDLIKSFNAIDTYSYLLYLRKIAKKFGLSLENSSNFYIARDFYNSKEIKERDPRMLFLLTMYGFRQQIRFNSNLDFNIPVGERWFNERIFERFISFSRMVREKNIVYESKNFDELDQYIEEDAFFYFDPPYRLTTATYNDGKRGFLGWNEEYELNLFRYISELSKKNIKFMLSYISQSGGIKNNNFSSWTKNNNFNVLNLGKVKGRNREELLIINYEPFRESASKIHNKE